MPVKIGEIAANIGANAATQGIGGILGMAFAGANDRRQIRQQTKLQNLQIAGQKEMTDYTYDKQLQMWKDTNYSAQMEQLRMAGLNPGLIYGMSGGGGTTTGSGGGTVTGATAGQGGGGEITTGMALQLGLQASQMKLLEAQARNLDADTANKGADTQNKGLQGNLLQLEQDFQTDTYQARVAKNHYEANIAMHESAIKYVDKVIAENGMMTKAYNAPLLAQKELEEANLRVAGLYLQNIQTEENTNLTKAQQAQVLQSIQTQIKQLQQTDRALNQKDQDILIDQARNELIKMGIWVGAASNIAGDLIKVLTAGKAGKR